MISSSIRNSSYVIRNHLVLHHKYHPCLIKSSRSIVTKVDTFLRGGVDYPVVLQTQNILMSFHDAYGTGNWAVDIVVATLTLRTIFSLPMMSWRTNIFYSYGKLRQKILIQSKKKLTEQARAWRVIVVNPDDEARKVQKLIKPTLKEEVLKSNDHPLRGIVVIGIEALLYVTFFLSIKNLCLGVPDQAALLAQSELKNTSFLWLSDLTTKDPYHLFPIMAFIACLTSTEYMNQARKQNVNLPKNIIFTALTTFGRLFSIVFFYIVLDAPSAIAVYWTTSTSMGLLQATLMANPSFKKLMRMPPESGYQKQVDLKMWAEDIKSTIQRWKSKANK